MAPYIGTGAIVVSSVTIAALAIESLSSGFPSRWIAIIGSLIVTACASALKIFNFQGKALYYGMKYDALMRERSLFRAKAGAGFQEIPHSASRRTDVSTLRGKAHQTCDSLTEGAFRRSVNQGVDNPDLLAQEALSPPPRRTISYCPTDSGLTRSRLANAIMIFSTSVTLAKPGTH